MKRLVVLITTLLCLAVPATALAYNPLDTACHASNGASNSAACSNDNNDPISGPHGVLKKATLIVAFIAGIAGVIIIIVAGFSYITSGGDAQKTANARSAIIGALVGLVIIVAAESILLFVLNKVQ